MRDFQIENTRMNKKYKRFEIKLKQDTAEQLKKQLERDEIDFTNWVRKQVDNYLKGGNE